MYSKEETKRLQQQSIYFSKEIKIADAQSSEELKDILRFHEYRYYVQHDPLISDGEYDHLYKLLEVYESAHPESIDATSPTQRVGTGLIKDFPKVQHLVPMLSLQNSYNETDLIDWDRKARELSGLENIHYCIEPKFDGASISVIYENDILSRGATRGDGEVGDDITPNIRQIRSMPLTAQFSKYGIEQVEIRGEVLINKKVFTVYNEKLVEAGGIPLANPRNAAAGSLRIKDTSEVGRRNLEAFLYHVSYFIADKKNQVPLTHSGILDMLWELGFRSPKKEMKIVTGIDAVIQHVNDFENQRDALPYEIDGMVIKVDDLLLQEKLGMTSHHPRWAIAYKFKARQATSKLLEVQYQVGRTGAVTPVAKIEPVQVGGVIVSSISIHNEEYIREKDLRLGDAILIERSGDVIPQIVKSLPDVRTGKEQKILFPTCCPECNDELFKTDEEAVWRCVNINCPAQVVERIIHFVSKDAMDIRHFGEANVRKFYSLQLLNDIPGVYHLDFQKIGMLEGMGKKSIDNLQLAIEGSKSKPLHRLIYALGIRYVGETTAKTLARSVKSIFDLQKMNEAELQQLEDVGIKVAASIVEFFKNYDNVHILERLQQAGVQMETTAVAHKAGGSLEGRTFLFTGTLNQLKRNEAEEMVEKNGGKIMSGVSSKLNYLVLGEDAGSKLEKARKLPSVNIISEQEFITMLTSE